MVPAFLRTLSARILLGFAVLIVTFAGTIVWIVSYMDDLGEEIGVIRTGYLQIALSTSELVREQQGLQLYLKEELPGEASPAAVTRKLAKLRERRDDVIGELETLLHTMENLPRGHDRPVRNTLRRVGKLRELIAALEPEYQVLIAAPPIERTLRSPSPPHDAAALDASRKALTSLLSKESSLRSMVDHLASQQGVMADRIFERLQRNARRLREYTLATGITAVVLGLLITAWVTITLRPLARLREGAKTIARGEYGLRIDERGTVEVADLAREFNAMGRAIEEREREVVRSERLAAVGKMAAMITHEVRNPLSSIALNTELLGDELDGLPEDATGEARALCRAITNEVDRLTAITEEYLAFARLPKPRLSPESVNAVVSSLATFVREDLAARGVTLEVSLDDALPRAMVDDGQLRQSLLNLVRNAAEALSGRGGGRVWLTTRRGEVGRVEVEVRDDGPGIPDAAQARLFDPFFSTKEGGTGLGLALTHHIVKDHGGDIHVSSEVEGGARFVVSLPQAPT